MSKRSRYRAKKLGELSAFKIWQAEEQAMEIIARLEDETPQAGDETDETDEAHE